MSVDNLFGNIGYFTDLNNISVQQITS